MSLRTLLSRAGILTATLLIIGCSDSTSPATSASLIAAKAPLNNLGSATPFTANVIAVNYKAGAAVVDLIVAVPFGIDNAARNGNANFSLHTTLQYVSTDNTVEILDSGSVSIRDKTVV